MRFYKDVIQNGTYNSEIVLNPMNYYNEVITNNTKNKTAYYYNKQSHILHILSPNILTKQKKKTNLVGDFAEDVYIKRIILCIYAQKSTIIIRRIVLRATKIP